MWETKAGQFLIEFTDYLAGLARDSKIFFLNLVQLRKKKQLIGYSKGQEIYQRRQELNIPAINFTIELGLNMIKLQKIENGLIPLNKDLSSKIEEFFRLKQRLQSFDLFTSSRAKPFNSQESSYYH